MPHLSARHPLFTTTPPTCTPACPSLAPADLYDNYYGKKPSVKLYVRRVFISDSFEDLLPK